MLVCLPGIGRLWQCFRLSPTGLIHPRGWPSPDLYMNQKPLGPYPLPSAASCQRQGGERAGRQAGIVPLTADPVWFISRGGRYPTCPPPCFPCHLDSSYTEPHWHRLEANYTTPSSYLGTSSSISEEEEEKVRHLPAGGYTAHRTPRSEINSMTCSGSSGASSVRLAVAMSCGMLSYLPSWSDVRKKWKRSLFRHRTEGKRAMMLEGLVVVNQISGARVLFCFVV